MKIVAPLRVQAVAAVFLGWRSLAIVQVAFRDDVRTCLPRRAAERACTCSLKLREQMVGAEVEDAVHGVQPQCIDVEVLRANTARSDEERDGRRRSPGRRSSSLLPRESCSAKLKIGPKTPR